MKLLKITIADLLDANGNKFSCDQAFTFADDNWNKVIDSILPTLSQKSKTPQTSEFWLNNLYLLNTFYRVQSLYIDLQKYGSLNPISVVENYKGTNGFTLVDGRHRCWAYMLYGSTEIDAEVYPCKEAWEHKSA